jgi:ADP-ribose pyrophosphatase
MTLQWYPIAEAVHRVFSGEIVNSLAVGGILAAYAVSKGIAEPRPVDAPWPDKSTAFSARQAAR